MTETSSRRPDQAAALRRQAARRAAGDEPAGAWAEPDRATLRAALEEARGPRPAAPSTADPDDEWDEDEGLTRSAGFPGATIEAALRAATTGGPGGATEGVAQEGLVPQQPSVPARARAAAPPPMPQPVSQSTPPMTPQPMPLVGPLAGPPPRPAPAADASPGAVEAAWNALPALALDPRHLDRNLVITARRTDPAHGAFDVLRTRILAEMERRGWRRLGITSPTKGCGKTFTAVNLAVTLSRYDAVRTLLLDLDLRQPAVARVLGVADPGAIGDLLRGLARPQAALRRVAPGAMQVGRLALGLNGRREAYASELFREARMGEALAEAEALLRPDLTLFDLPPALAQDDVLALRPHYDALLLVAGGGQTTPRELKEAARRVGSDTPILGVVLNKAEGEEVSDYAYAYD